MMKRIWEQRGISLSMRFFFRFLDYIWHKDRSLIVFSGGRDVGYSDNSRYLFERFIDVYSEEFEIVWVTPSRKLLDDVGVEERIRNRIVYQYSAKGIRSLLRAKTIFFCWGSSDLPGTDFSKRTIVIQLWHGIPIKRIGICSKQLSKGQMDSAARAYRKFTYWICSSKIERNSVALCTGLPIDNVKVTGYPRNDYLIEHKNSMDSKMLTRFPFLEKTVILYAPTYRSNGKLEFFPFDDFKIEEMRAFLEKRDAYLILRTHHVDDVVAARSLVLDCRSFGSDRIITLNRDSVRDVQEILPYVDILISDYSGIWVDFLLLDRPIVFVPYDLATYENNDGLLYDYNYVTPGPKVSQFSELLRDINSYCSDSSKDSDKRNRIKRMFHEYEDGMAYKRIIQLVRDESSKGQ